MFDRSASSVPAGFPEPYLYDRYFISRLRKVRGGLPLRTNHLDGIKAQVELAIHCNWLVTKDLHQLLFVSTRRQLVVERLELTVAHVCEHLSRQLCTVLTAARIRSSCSSLKFIAASISGCHDLPLFFRLRIVIFFTVCVATVAVCYTCSWPVT